MKKQKFAGLFVGLCMCAAPFMVKAQSSYVTIMPFGDSVTARGSAPESSYRYWLWTYLQNAGFNNFDFIGNQNGVSDNGTPANSWPDEQYEGGDGWTSADALNQAPSAATFDGGPTIVLLDFGSNDISPAGIPLSQTRANLKQIIQDFVAANPNVIILIAKPTPFAPDPSSSGSARQAQRRQQSQLAALVGQVAHSEHKAGVRIAAIDLFDGFNVQKDTVDGAHPNVRGEQMIARKYFLVLRNILKHE
jgi:lysophospholipase L1-like esterase